MFLVLFLIVVCCLLFEVWCLVCVVVCCLLCGGVRWLLAAWCVLSVVRCVLLFVWCLVFDVCVLFDV